MKTPEVDEDHVAPKPGYKTIAIENAWLDEVDRRIRLQDVALIDDIEAEDLYRELRQR
jgi:hypothetical protein